MSDERDPDVEYWFHQARTYADRLADDLGVTADHEHGRVIVRTPEDYGRGSMAEVIRRFEHGGFTIDSSTTDDHVEITVSSDRLPAPYYAMESEPADFGGGTSTGVQDL